MSDTNWDEVISAYLDNELSAEERAQVEELLAGDPRARQTLECYTAQRRLFQQLPRRRLSAEAEKLVLSAVAAAHETTRRPARATAEAGPIRSFTRSGARPAPWSKVNWRPATLFATSLAALVLVAFIWLRNRDGHLDPLAQGPANKELANRANAAGTASDPRDVTGELGFGNPAIAAAPPASADSAERSGTDALDLADDASAAPPKAMGEELARMSLGATNERRAAGGGTDSLLDENESHQGQMAKSGLFPGRSELAEGREIVSESLAVDQMCIVSVPDRPEEVAKLVQSLSESGLLPDGFSLENLTSGQAEVLYVRAQPEVMAQKVNHIAQSAEVLLFDPAAPLTEDTPAVPGAVPTIPRDAQQILLAQVFNNMDKERVPHEQRGGGLGGAGGLGVGGGRFRIDGQNLEGRGDATVSDEVIPMGRSQVAQESQQQQAVPFQLAENQSDARQGELALNEWLQTLSERPNSFHFLRPGQAQSIAADQQRLIVEPARIRNQDGTDRQMENLHGQTVQQQMERNQGEPPPGRYIILFGKDLPLEQLRLQAQQPKSDLPGN